MELSKCSLNVIRAVGALCLKLLKACDDIMILSTSFVIILAKFGHSSVDDIFSD